MQVKERTAYRITLWRSRYKWKCRINELHGAESFLKSLREKKIAHRLSNPEVHSLVQNSHSLILVLSRMKLFCIRTPSLFRMHIIIIISSSSSMLLLLLLSLVTGLFFPVPLLNQSWSPSLSLQVPYCSSFRIMCDVPSIAVFCSESIDCFPGMVSKFFLKHFITIPVAPFVTGIIFLRFYIRCISVHKLLSFSLFSSSLCTTFLSVGTATSTGVLVFFLFSFFFFFFCF